MLCDKCKKREATIHIKEVHDGKCVSTNLCAECAREKELAGGLGAFGFNLAEVIFNMGKMNGAKEQEEPKKSEVHEEETALVCPRCGWTLEKMRGAAGKMGCPECYRTFSKWVNMAVEQVQRGRVHVGRRPRRRGRTLSGVRMEMDRLQLELAAAVSAEEYEKAAQVRDRIGALKNELEKLSGEGVRK